jgi:prepilin-type N-terminal cleavage/methylation domain-containing protein
MKNMLQKIRSQESGFTLIELLIVITIIAALAVTVFVALNPVKRLADSRDSRRSADVETILTAIHEYVVDNKGSLPTGLTTSMTEKMLGTGATGCQLTQANCAT